VRNRCSGGFDRRVRDDYQQADGVFQNFRRSGEGCRRCRRVQARMAEQTISVLERPRLFPICEPNFVGALSGLARHYVTHAKVPLREQPSVGFVLRNYGRTPAILLSVNAKVSGPAGDPPSEDTSYPLIDLPKEQVIHPSKACEKRVASLTAFAGDISRSEYDDLMAARKFWWFFGTVTFDDIWGGKNTFHFCWRYDQSLQTFNPHPRERNYTEHDPPAVRKSQSANETASQQRPIDARRA
jgi:hypothetical protein